MKKYFLKICFPTLFITLMLIGAAGLPEKVVAAGEIPCTIPNPNHGADENATELLIVTPERCAELHGVPGTPLGVGAKALAQDAVNGVGGWVIKGIGVLAISILKVAAYLTYLAGAVLNFVTQHTVVNMAANMSDATVINTAWTGIRDVANMLFIFVLLYAAIRTILGLGGETQKLIINVVVVAILINFSLFFTKVVIDASNVLAITFYDAIAPGALTADKSIGISDSLMAPLGLQNLYKVTGIDPDQFLIIGVMGTIIALVAAFVFFAISIMFIIRFVILIFVLILSPLAFMGFILPELGKYRDQWKNALLGQAFFAPIFFLLTWIVIVVAKGLKSNPENWVNLTGTAVGNGVIAAPPTGTIELVVNFIVIMAFLIASLILAKNVSNMAGPVASGMTKWAMGAAGGATLGGTGWIARNTAGRFGQYIGENEKLKEKVSQGGMGGMAARLTLATGRKAGGGSFDIRGTALGGSLDAGKAGGKGGFADYRKKKSEAEAKFADTLKPSDRTVAKAQRDLKDVKDIDHTTEEFGEVHKQAVIDQRRIVREKREELTNKEEAYRTYTEEVRTGARRAAPEEVKAKREEMEKIRKDVTEGERRAAQILSREGFKNIMAESAQQKVDELKGVDDDRAKEMVKDKVFANDKERKEEIARLKKEFKGAGEVRKKKFAEATENSIWAKTRGYNYTAAAAIRKNKSAKDKMADAAKEMAREDGGGEAEAPETPAAPATPTIPTP